MTEQTNQVHPFERTLGQGPYKFVGTFDLGAVLACLNAGNIGGYNNGLAMAPKIERGLGTCSHCGKAITYICIVQIGDGKRFGVGSDCIEKVSLPQREMSMLRHAKLKHERELRQKRKAKKGDEARIELKQIIESHKDTMAKLPSPSNPNRTMLDWASWCLERSNNGGVVIVLKRVKALLSQG